MSISELASTLKHTWGWHKSRADCLVYMVISLLKTCTVNLKVVACAMDSSAQMASTYRRLQRFFAQVTIPCQLVAKLLVSFFFSDDWRKVIFVMG